MPIVEPLSVASLDYLRAFNLKCVAISKTGRVFTCNNPAGMAGAWWVKADDADRIAAAAWSTGDVPSAAAKLGLVVTPHATVLRRVGERTAALDEAIKAAISDGVLREFNAQYRSRRLAAKRDGQRFISYGQALGKLRKVVAGAVANGGKIPTRSFVAAVFEDPPARKNQLSMR